MTGDDVGQIKRSLVSGLSDAIAESKIPALDLAANYEELSQYSLKALAPKLEVLGLSDTRGSAPVAQQLYRESAASTAARALARAQRLATRDGFRPPEQRPDKRARRLIRALGDLNML